MQCPRCHTESREGRRFCAGCGLSLGSACPACGFRNVGGEQFCGGCGSPLVSPPATTESQFGTPESYTPRHLAERILTSKASLEGERKQVTVLFADLKGSMELLVDRDPEEARKLLDPVLERMMEAVHHYEGTVNQVMGDGIMALFGAPLTHEDHALRACHAALRMQDAIHRYTEDLQRSQGIEVQIRVGLNSGDVVVRAIGNDLRMDYTAVGQTTHLAARMEQLAAPGTILLAPATRQLVEGYVQVEARGPLSVKGLADPVIVYTLTGTSVQRTRLQATAVRGLTRFVGRETEVEQIRGALALARDGHGQIVALAGEPGVGKSRFLYELTHSDGIQAWLTLEAASVSYGKGSSYLPVIDLLKGYFKMHERDSHREIREKGPAGYAPSITPWSRSSPPFSPCSMFRSRTPAGRGSIPLSAASAPWRRSSASCCARAGSNRCSSSSRTCTGSTRRRRPCSTTSSRGCPPPGSSCSSATGPAITMAGSATPATVRCGSTRSRRGARASC